MVIMTLSLLIGVSLGLLGGGGSILTVPLLTYGAGITPNTAIASSLFVVAITSGVGLITHARAGRVRWRTGLIFGAAGSIGSYGGGQFGALLPGRLLMILFGVVMLVTAIAMMRKPRNIVPRSGDISVGKASVLGILVGIVTGILGAGGGFLVVSALVLVAGLSMPIAIGTSLVVISMNATAGFVGHLAHIAIDWPITIAVTVAAMTGGWFGGKLVARIPAATLRRGFGVLIVAMATLILIKELF